MCNLGRNAHQTQHHQPVKIIQLFNIAVASFGILHAVLGLIIREGSEGLCMHSEDGNKAGERAGRQVL